MKKKIVVLVLMTFLILCGCGKQIPKEKEEVAPVKEKEIAALGEYELYSAKVNSRDVTGKELNAIRPKYRVVIQDNGSARVLFANKWYTASYDIEYLTVINGNNKKIKVKYIYNNNSMDIYYDNGIFTFVKKK